MKNAALVFALWEVTKAVIGKRRIDECVKTPELCFLIFFVELPYTAWAVWLILHDAGGGAVLWGLGFIAIALHIMNRKAAYIFAPVNCGASFLALLAIYWGRL